MELSYYSLNNTLPPLTKEEEIELGKRKNSGDEKAKEELINRNIKLVFSCVKKKYDQAKDASLGGISFEDMVQDGLIGLITAVDKYDWEKNCKFSTIATYWINLKINESIENSKTIRLPNFKSAEIVKIKKNIENLERVLKRPPTINEIVLYFNNQITEKYITEVYDFFNMGYVLSINKQTDESDQDSEQLCDLIPDDDIDGFQKYSETVCTEERNNVLFECLNTLTKEEREVIKMSFGLNEEKEEYDLEKIRQKLFSKGIRSDLCSKQQILNIKKKALVKLRRSLQLRDFEENYL